MGVLFFCTIKERTTCSFAHVWLNCECKEVNGPGFGKKFEVCGLSSGVGLQDSGVMWRCGLCAAFFFKQGKSFTLYIDIEGANKMC
jgi:hypothetical protein